jgi:hypothetical protein
MYSLIRGGYIEKIFQMIWKTEEVDEAQDISGSDPYLPIILCPAMIHLRETEILERNDIFRMISSNKHFRTLRFSIPNFYSIYLLSYFILDILDLLSNELFFVQTKIELWFDSDQEAYMEEFKTHIKKNVLQLQKKRVLPVYANFLKMPAFHIEHSVIFDQRFHVLYIKESTECLSIQRIYFSIDL